MKAWYTYQTTFLLESIEVQEKVVVFEIHEKLHYRTRDDIILKQGSDLEYEFIELKAKRKNIFIGSLYRPQHTKEKDFLKDYKHLIELLKQETDMEIVIDMDHNMDLLKASKHTNTQGFLDYNKEMDLLPVSSIGTCNLVHRI